MAVDITVLDAHTAARLTRGRFGVNPDKEEIVIYYRKPDYLKNGEPNVEAGWITRADSQQMKQATFVLNKGWTPLPQYGRVEDSNDPWAPILATAAGRQEFPLEQILTYRWYDARKLRQQWPSMPPGVRPEQLFPQLRGRELQLYPCPECFNQDFLVPSALAHHLRIHHAYDRTEIIALGKDMGIDFSREFRARKLDSITFDDAAPEAGDLTPTALGLDLDAEPINVTRVPVRSHKGKGADEEPAE